MLRRPDIVQLSTAKDERTAGGSPSSSERSTPDDAADCLEGHGALLAERADETTQLLIKRGNIIGRHILGRKTRPRVKRSDVVLNRLLMLDGRCLVCPSLREEVPRFEFADQVEVLQEVLH